MARYKEFDREQVLQLAMELFWARGYEGTSIQDLVAAMGIKRQSLYNTFGDKHTLYLLALDRYREVETRRQCELLQEAGSVRQALRRLFSDVIKKSTREKQRRGCFMGNAMSELGGRCKATTARACHHISAMEGAFYQALLRGKINGEFEVRDPRAVARFLSSSLLGLILISKVTADRKMLEDVVRMTLSVVN